MGEQSYCLRNFIAKQPVVSNTDRHFIMLPFIEDRETGDSFPEVLTRQSLGYCMVLS